MCEWVGDSTFTVMLLLLLPSVVVFWAVSECVSESEGSQAADGGAGEDG